jgi:hypothetical protein
MVMIVVAGHELGRQVSGECRLTHLTCAGKEGSVSVIARAGVFFVRTIGALHQIQIELLSHRFAVGSLLDLHDNGKVVAFRKSNIGHEHVALLGETQTNWIRSATTDDLDDLLANRLSFFFFVYRSDLDLAVISYEELKMRLYGCEKSSAIWPIFDASVIVVMIVLFSLGVGVIVIFVIIITVIMVTVFVFFAMVVIMIVIMSVVIAANGDQGKCNCGEDEGYGLDGLFHNVSIGDDWGEG